MECCTSAIVFGDPLLVYVDPRSTDWQDLYQIVWKKVQRYAEVPIHNVCSMPTHIAITITITIIITITITILITIIITISITNTTDFGTRSFCAEKG